MGSGTDVAEGAMDLILDTPPPTYTAFSTTVPAGTSMISIPAFTRRDDAATVLGVPANQLLLARADGAVTSFQPWRQGDIYRLWPATPPFEPGYGYWITTSSAINLSYQGVPAGTTTPYTLFLPPGWQQIGNPFATLTINLQDLQLQPVDGTAAQTLADAQTSGLISSGIFSYTGSGYALVSTATALTPYQGYWINVLAPLGVDLIFPNVASTRRGKAAPLTRAALKSVSAASTASTTPARAAGTLSDWQLTLAATAGNLADPTATLGVAPAAKNGYSYLDIPTPPPFGPYLSVNFPHSDWGTRSGRYTRDLRGLVTGSQSWDVNVESDSGGRAVTVSWPDLSQVPAQVSLVLTDLSNGTQRFMRSTSAYTFTLGTSAVRNLRVTAQVNRGGGLSIGSLAVVATRGMPQASVSYTLSAPATVELRLAGLGGHVVRTVTSGRAAVGGANQLVFAPVDAEGRALPNGVYRVELIAVADDGQMVRAARLITLAR
jgi:hypothetical protein